MPVRVCYAASPPVAVLVVRSPCWVDLLTWSSSLSVSRAASSRGQAGIDRITAECSHHPWHPGALGHPDYHGYFIGRMDTQGDLPLEIADPSTSNKECHWKNWSTRRAALAAPPTVRFLTRCRTAGGMWASGRIPICVVCLTMPPPMAQVCVIARTVSGVETLLPSHASASSLDRRGTLAAKQPSVSLLLSSGLWTGPELRISQITRQTARMALWPLQRPDMAI
ncbi:hypothetical protein GGTG_08395 [Gaeumannomyces tritici R3-111a-1]|uniref:Uncharacterized protein n=1 Tax=Gaeumannomyces tritici (strain R3-111a-1) TaxID=644352 RepID=J3P4F8_GAET3|nr:hypothetical protein GGTG_08395 [Gaeumannomyces tritici R3-111a-1]EJT74555.1 hypothetical protein GGTG_08395 [Gaeumannomyces tritici R3-111a-1]